MRDNEKENIEKFILVTKMNKNNEIALKQFIDFLKEENIEYKEKLEEEWIGIRQPKYIANISFYVKENDVVRVNKVIEDLENATIQTKDYEELKETTKEKNDWNTELDRYEKRKKILQRIMIYSIFSIVGICVILTIILNFI